MTSSASLQAAALGALLTIATSGYADTIYKCKAAKGKLQYQSTPCEQQSISSWQTASSNQPEAVSLNKIAEPFPGPAPEKTALTLTANAFSPFWVRGHVNGVAANMLMDSGAEYVAVPLALGKQLGLPCFKWLSATTANGYTSVCKSEIKELEFGGIALHNVPAVVANTSEVLLGQAALRQLRVEQDGSVMRLSIRN